MKKKYEKQEVLFISIFILFITYIVFIDILFTKTYNKYILINASIESNEIINMYISNKELKYLKANHYIYIKDKKYKRKIIEVNRNIIKKGKISYHEIKLNVNLEEKYKEKDNIKIKVFEKKEKLYKIFKSCWKE